MQKDFSHYKAISKHKLVPNVKSAFKENWYNSIQEMSNNDKIDIVPYLHQSKKCITKFTKKIYVIQFKIIFDDLKLKRNKPVWTTLRLSIDCKSQKVRKWPTVKSCTSRYDTTALIIRYSFSSLKVLIKVCHNRKIYNKNNINIFSCYNNKFAKCTDTD